MEPEAIRIPAEMLPLDGRFGPGPSAVRAEFLEELAATGISLMGTSHRRPGVKSVVRRVTEGLRSFFRLPEGYRIGLGNGGGSLGWDMGSLCLVESKATHFCYGEFSSKWAQWAAAIPGIEVGKVEAPYGRLPDLAPRPGSDFHGLALCETSTGVYAADLPVMPDGSLLGIDAVSAAGGVEIDWSRIDYLFFSPQKCFGSDGGLCVSIVSPRAWERCERLMSAKRRYVPELMRLDAAVANAEKDQTLNTPAIATLFLMARQIEWMNGQGDMSHWARVTRAKADCVYGWAESWEMASPYVADPALRSPTVATIDLVDGVDAGALCKVLRGQGIVDVEAYRKLGRNQIRIAMFPNVAEENLRRLTRCVEYAVGRLTA